MIEWLDDFYSDPDMRSTVLRNFLPLFTQYVTEATGGPVAASFVQSLAENYVERHLGSSRAQLQEVVKGADDPLAALAQRFDEWEEKRPGKVAANELVRSANAAQVEKFREAGVTKMVWRASGGKTCPFCTELDGTIISVDGTFFEAGDELNPEGATAPIHFESSLGHPPVHQGCVCSVEAVTEAQTGELTAEQREEQVWFTSDVTWDGAPPAGEPHVGYYDASGWGLKRGAAEREAQMRALAESEFVSGKPPELLALEGNMTEAREQWRFGWQDSSDGPMQAMTARILNETEDVSGMVWSRGQPLLEPSDAMRALTDDIYQTTQGALTQDSYTLYRGIKTADGSGNVLGSWTTDPDIARRFDGYAVYEAEVPKERIFLDLSSDTEKEMIVMGGADLPLVEFERDFSAF